MMQSAMRWSFKALVIAATLGLMASAAVAAQNVANTAQKGSLLVFPLIDLREGNTTVIRLANDANQAVDIKCYFVNQTKFRRDFVFRLTKKQAVSFNTRTGTADVLGSLPPFPTEIGEFPEHFPGRPANPFLGELVCFAVNPGGSAQISHNHLSGTATVGVIENQNGPDAIRSDSSFQFLVNSYEYNSWNFAARGVPRGQEVGTPGRLDLTGQGGGYDACPAYNIVHLSPTAFVNGTLVDHRIGVSSCLQDLRQDYTPHFTKLEFHIWNAHEIKFTGAWECANSTHSYLLSEMDVLPTNASREVLGTDTAHAQIRGVASARCDRPGFPTETTGLVAVSARVANFNFGGEGEQEIPLHGTTANHAGVHAVPGFVLWDTQDAEVPEAPRR